MADWGGLGAIVKEAQKLAEEERVEIACPKCGTPLDVNKVGVRNCPMGHWRSDDGSR